MPLVYHPNNQPFPYITPWILRYALLFTAPLQCIVQPHQSSQMISFLSSSLPSPSTASSSSLFNFMVFIFNLFKWYALQTLIAIWIEIYVYGTSDWLSDTLHRIHSAGTVSVLLKLSSSFFCFSHTPRFRTSPTVTDSHNAFHSNVKFNPEDEMIIKSLN